MPILEYRCLACDRRFEHLQRHNSPAPVCPACGASQLEQEISLSGVSSDTRSAANLSAAHARAAQRRGEKARAEHAQHHDHFGDTSH